MSFLLVSSRKLFLKPSKLKNTKVFISIKMDKLKLKITILVNVLLGLLIVLSFINAIFLVQIRTENHIWFIIIIGINIMCSIFAIVILMVFSIFFFRAFNRDEKLSKLKIINSLIFILCLILIFLSSFFAYLLFIRGYESSYLLVTTLLLFLTYSCRIIIVGSIFLIFTLFINSCQTCFKRTDEPQDESRRSNNVEVGRSQD
jgi:uncharacterized BrkB/YihY/UPF0761 family membrane protein